MTEYVKSETSFAADFRFAAQLFPDNGPVFISHEGHAPIIAPDYLKKAGCPEPLIEKAFSPTGEWIFPEDNTDLYKLPPIQLIEYMLAVAAPLYEIAQWSLGEINWFGYNDHGVSHIRSVAVSTLRLLQQGGYDEDVQRRGVISAIGHDLGNGEDRDIHSLISAKILGKVFPQLTTDSEQWRIIRRAMEFHDGEVYDRYVAQWAHLPVPDRLEKMRQTLGPEALAVLAADKMDVGRHRVNRKALSPAAIDEHAYSEVNLTIETEAAEITHSDRAFHWELGFIPYLRDYELERFAQLAIPCGEFKTGYAMYASSRVKKNNKESADFLKSIALFAKKHMSRNLLTVQAIFALFPNVSDFNLDFLVDGQSAHLDIFHVGQLDVDLNKFRQRFS